MNTETMKDLVQQALCIMEQAGTSPSYLRKYRQTGFGSFVRHFNKLGLTNYSENVVTDLVIQTRGKFEQGKISACTWRLIRRSGELLRIFYTTGTLDLPVLPKWEALHNPLRLEPSCDQLADSDNILGLIWKTKQALARFGLLPKTLRNYEYDGFDKILRRHMEKGLTHYSRTLTQQIANDARTRYERGEMCRSVYQNVRKTAALLDEYYETRTLKWHKVSNWELRQPSRAFLEALDTFYVDTVRSGVFAKQTINVAKSAARGLLFEIENAGFITFDGITLDIMSEAISRLARRFSGGRSSMLFSIKIFLQYLYQSDITPDDLSISIPELVAQKRTVRKGFSSEEIDNLLNAVDHTTTVGNRDYAMMLLATQTGLRACDIANLKRNNIDWRNHEIHLVQQKTGKAFSLPLEPECGNAIAIYLLHYRPDCNLPYVFLCNDHPHRPLDMRSVSTRISVYMGKAKVNDPTIPRRGAHSFRRAFGTRLLESEVPLDLISQLLGHEHPDSAKPYLSVNETGLKSCALGLVTDGKVGEQ